MKYLIWLTDGLRLLMAIVAGALYSAHLHVPATLVALMIIVGEPVIERFTQQQSIYRWVGGYWAVPVLIIVGSFGLSSANILPVPVAVGIMFVLGMVTISAEIYFEPGLHDRLEHPTSA